MMSKIIIVTGFASILLSLNLYALDKYSTMKTSCMQASEYKTINKLKEVLLLDAKKEAINELYGEFISSNMSMTNGNLVLDEVKKRAMGSIRIKGNPNFHNGDDFGSMCVDITAYITKKDLAKFLPKKIELSHLCYTNPEISIKDIKQNAKYKAYLEIVTRYKPSFQLSGKEASQFVHSFSIKKENFDFKTSSYCFDAVGTLLPFELDTKKSLTVDVDDGNYKGELKNGKKNGYGEYIDKKGNVYKGNFRDDKYNGYGELKLTNGFKYIGQFKDDKADGYGTIYFPDGRKIIGDFKDDNLNGQAKQININGTTLYDGNWKNNKRNGYGTLYYTDGGKYIGNFKDGKIEGKGRMIRPNGMTEYVGNFKNGKKNGEGIYYTTDGSQYIGYFTKGNLNGKGKVLYANGKICYEGSFKNYSYDGYGIKYDSNGYKYIGYFKDGKFDGYGKEFDENGKLFYEGSLKDGKPDGYGTFYYTNGDK